MKTNKNNKPKIVDFYMWLGEDGEAVEVTEKEFEELQENWKGLRPSDFERND